MANDGLSRSRLSRLRDIMGAHVAARRLPGAVWLYARHGELHVETLGRFELDGGREMARDTLFRLASMTKPIVALAALTLIEECTLRLDDAVTRWLPELADRRVLRASDGPLDDTVPARRDITVRDLLAQRMGLGHPWGLSRQAPILRAEAELGLGTLGPWPGDPTLSTDEWLRRLGTLPLLRQPGEAWLYDTPSEVLGVLLARVTGRPLQELLAERVFSPLGMKDTGFFVPADKQTRLPPAYKLDDGGALALADAGGAASRFAQPPAFPSGAGGLVSTVDDYYAFARLLADGGRAADGVRLVSRPTLLAMTCDQTNANERAASPWLESGWGFGVGVWSQRDTSAASPGRYGWDGGWGTSWRNDPAEDVIAILMIQRVPNSSRWPEKVDFYTGLYAAIDD